MLAVVFSTFFARIVGLGVFLLPAWVGIRIASHLERETQEWSLRTELLLLTLVAYLVVVAAATIVPLQSAAVSGARAVSLIPGFSTIGCYRRLTGTPVEVVICDLQVLGNIALFIPMGILVPIVSPRFASFRWMLLIGLVMSVSIECIQYFQQSFGALRNADIDDVILNTVGVLIGYGLFRLTQWHERSDRFTEIVHSRAGSEEGHGEAVHASAARLVEGARSRQDEEGVQDAR